MAKRESRVGPKENDPRSSLFQSAVDLFSEKGYEATSVREIVDRAGVTKPVLYYYFGSKEGLLHHILEHASGIHQEALRRALAYEGTVLERLTHLYELVTTEAGKHRNLGKMVSSMTFSPVPIIPQEYVRKLIKTTSSVIR
jgi:AcrR family transcriptional regulator